MAWSGMTLGRERRMNSWLIGSRRCGAVVVTMAASAMHASKAPLSHRFPQMCAVLQPLRDNMAQSSSFVQVCFSFHKLFHYVSVIFLLLIHYFLPLPSTACVHISRLSLSLFPFNHSPAVLAGRVRYRRPGFSALAHSVLGAYPGPSCPSALKST
jgi:hypothetical protein